MDVRKCCPFGSSRNLCCCFRSQGFAHNLNTPHRGQKQRAVQQYETNPDDNTIMSSKQFRNQVSDDDERLPDGACANERNCKYALKDSMSSAVAFHEKDHVVEQCAEFNAVKQKYGHRKLPTCKRHERRAETQYNRVEQIHPILSASFGVTETVMCVVHEVHHRKYERQCSNPCPRVQRRIDIPIHGGMVQKQHDDSMRLRHDVRNERRSRCKRTSDCIRAYSDPREETGFQCGVRLHGKMKMTRLIEQSPRTDNFGFTDDHRIRDSGVSTIQLP